MSTAPPRLAEWILRRFLSEEDAETVSGDFEETARARVVSGFTPRATRYWVLAPDTEHRVGAPPS